MIAPAHPIRRVMWLLNHGAARRFEIPMLKRAGISEIYLPKSFPAQVSFRSADVDYSEDASLSIPSTVLEHFNTLDWYAPQPKEIWHEASRYFDLVFFINEDIEAATAILRHFEGASVWRAYGADKSTTYTILGRRNIEFEQSAIRAAERFWLGQAYSNLAKGEASYIARRSIDLPLGMLDTSVRDEWRGSDPRLLFVCPDLGFSDYYQNIYDEFKRHFGDLPYVVGGSQPIKVTDPKVLGYLPAADYARNMRDLRAMYYHSQEPRHVHYHPFEAIRAGMPLVFRSGGLLDELGGRNLPGRATSVRDAREKLRRILDGDNKYTDAVRASQPALLDAMNFERMVPTWQAAVSRILKRLEEAKTTPAPHPARKKRIGIIVPVRYRGGSLRGAKLLAKALLIGSQRAGAEADIVLGHLDDPETYAAHDFADLPSPVKVRAFKWRHLDRMAARRAMGYAGFRHWEGKAERYDVPDDGIKQFGDCDLWVFISDRLEAPILPMRPYVLMVYDYIQRYVPILRDGADTVFLHAARSAKRVLVTTDFTRKDAIAYAGVPQDKVIKVPMLAPEPQDVPNAGIAISSDYFIWSTNAGPHKNHAVALEALSIYYQSLRGNLDCVVTGVNSVGIVRDQIDKLRSKGKVTSQILRQRLKLVGDLRESDYQAALKGAAFCWHPGTIDNGTFCVVEAANLGVPSLSSDYPAMREINDQFRLGLAFSPSDDCVKIAERLKWMQDTAAARRELLPNPREMHGRGIEDLSDEYWAALRELI